MAPPFATHNLSHLPSGSTCVTIIQLPFAFVNTPAKRSQGGQVDHANNFHPGGLGMTPVWGNDHLKCTLYDHESQSVL